MTEETKEAIIYKPGMIVKIHQKIKEMNTKGEEKERIQIFKGLVIRINAGHKTDKTFTVRKVVEGVGVEKIFPLHLPKIEKIEIKKKSKIRRAKLYYMRERSGKSARLKETFVSNADVEKEAEREAAIEELAEQKAKEAAEENGTTVKTVETPTETVETPVVEETTTAETTPVEETSATEQK